MATVDKTWVFTADTEGLADVGDSLISVVWDATPQALEFTGGSSGTTERARRASTGQTWETWGVPVGATVDSLQIMSYNTQRFSAAVTATLYARVLDSSAVTVHSGGDLFTLALSAATDGSPVVQSAGPSWAVNGGKQASTTDVRLEVQLTLASPHSAYDLDVDAILLRMTYTPANTVAPDGVFRDMRIKGATSNYG